MAAASVHSEKHPQDLHHPPDSPLSHFPLPTDAGLATLPPAVEREVEDALRRAQRHALQVEAYADAVRDARNALVYQCGWLACGALLGWRGYKFADPFHSVLKPYTESVVINKLTHPVAILGGVMSGVTMWQLPADIQFYRNAVGAVDDEKRRLSAVLAARNARLAEYGLERLAKGTAPPK